ncbi:MAG: hypothetical protein WKF37_02245 [Bryobacteraceae bacterium]
MYSSSELGGRPTEHAAGRYHSGHSMHQEDVSVRASGKSAVLSSSDWADRQVARQLDGMGTGRYEVGVLTVDKAKGKQMSLWVLEASEVIHLAANLRRLNAAGADIHIRPKEAGGYSLSLWMTLGRQPSRG